MSIQVGSLKAAHARIAMEQQRAAALVKSGLGAAAAGQAAAAALFGGPGIGSEAAALVASTSSPPADSSGAKARVKVRHTVTYSHTKVRAGAAKRLFLETSLIGCRWRDASP